MRATLRYLLEHRFDYAGLFPPASLELSQALQNYRHYRSHPHAWMLGQFVCPASKLDLLLAADPAIPVAVVGGGAEPAQFLARVEADTRSIVAIHSRWPDTIRTYEIRLPSLSPPGDLGTILARIPETIQVFFEGPVGQVPSREALHVLAQLRPRSGYKLRCGGAEARAFPGARHVAEVLCVCEGEKVPVKLTAGLHHPLRWFDAGLQTYHHGFVNVLLADALHRAGKLTLEEMEQLLEDGEPQHFHFDDEQCGWLDHRLALAELRQAGLGIVAIGSCSFDEPREYLSALGWC
jgi:hypothetical protein